MNRKYAKQRIIRRFKVLVSCVLMLSLVFSSGYCIYASGPAERPTIIIDTESGETVKDLADVNGKWKDKGGAVPTSVANFKVDGKSTLLMSALDGNVLYENNADEKLPIASVTKIMTLLLIMESIDSGLLTYDQVLVTSAYAESMGGSQIWLVEGEQMNVKDLLKAVAIVSANDASVVFAEAISGNEKQFVTKMNTRAKELGMSNTDFKDSNGLDDSGYSSARDVAIMSRELLKHSEILEYTTTWMDVLRAGDSQLVNTNRLVRFYEGATGLKTGTTSKSGHCLSATAEREGFELIAVVLGCDSTDKRFASARQMLDFGYANFSVHKPAFELSNLKSIKVRGGTIDSIKTEIDEPIPFVIPRGKEGELKESWLFPESIEAPVVKKQVIGKVVIEHNEVVVAEYKLYSADEVSKMTFGRALLKLLKNLVT